MSVPTLPSQDSDPHFRQEQIRKARDARQIDYSAPIGVACQKDMTPADEPTPEYRRAMGMAYGAMRQHFASLSLPELYNEKDLIFPRMTLLPKEMPQMTPVDWAQTINVLTQSMPKARARSLDAYGTMAAALKSYQLYPLLKSAPERHNEFFGWQRIAGVNPYILSQVTELPDHFPVTERHFQTALATLRPGVSDGDSLARARSEGRLFLSDAKVLDGVATTTTWQRRKYLSATMGLFLRPIDASAALLPIAIQCGQKPGPQAPIFTPADNWRWRIAQAFLGAAEGAIHEAGEHLATTHLVMEAFALASERNLSPNHPMMVLLAPHFEGTHIINYTARHNLIAEDGTLDQMMAQPVAITRAVAALVLSSFRVDQGAPRQRLHARGLLSNAGLVNSPYREDALPLWDAILHWVSDYVGVYYDTDAAVASDPELQHFIHDLGASDGARLAGVPVVITRLGLAELVTLAIFTGSVHHAAVNFTQFPFMGFVPNMPGALYAPPPTLATDDTEESLLKALPPLDMAALQMYTVWQLSGLNQKKLGAYDGVFTDPRVKPFHDAFKARLAEISAAMNAPERPRRTLPYAFLDPKNIPSSINI